MPSVLVTLTRRDASPSTGTDTAASTSTSTTDPTRPWIILAAVAALLTLGACTALVVISLSKRRLLKRQLDESRRRDSGFDSGLDSGRAWEKPSRKRKMTAEALEMEAESTRTAIIRKSLAGRTASFATSHRSSMAERPESGDGDGPRYDWKDFEAGFSRHSSVASLRRSSSPMPELPAPTLSRSSSPSRNPLLVGRAELPPPLEQHPCLRQ
ncbi:hypothetical protein KVR01_003869 [Diaporthe batatas]|uniref:uncharacterized protein n=1 Tax=Diaporthe batatas TaxID=748121 RepID=UPI001D035E7D|nr:uncharacterized protein KVR01_003869 [Diaporthe batatas]KAG8168180.1 hypothetical protein KVR01_003869 [Diaporthe batatas]